MTRDTSLCPRCGKCRDDSIRITEAIVQLDYLADLLAESAQLPVGQLGAVQRLNDIISDLAGCHCPPQTVAALEEVPPP